MATEQSEDKRPTPDRAEDKAFFPSPYSLSQFTSRLSPRLQGGMKFWTMSWS